MDYSDIDKDNYAIDRIKINPNTQKILLGKNTNNRNIEKNLNHENIHIALINNFGKYESIKYDNLFNKLKCRFGKNGEPIF